MHKKTTTNPTLTYWEAQTCDVRGMMLNSQAEEFEGLERAEILSHVPDVSGATMMELAAGIGRFTGYFAEQVKDLTVVDFVGAFIEANQEKHGHHEHLRFLHTNVMEIELPEHHFDFIFSNWLMMYLNDQESRALIQRVHRWLKPSGGFFFRESCFGPSNPNSKHPHSYYRHPDFYMEALEGLFAVTKHGNVGVYAERYGNPNQLWWLCQRIDD